MENEIEYGLEIPVDPERPDQEPAEPEPIQPEEPEKEEPEQGSEEPEQDPEEGSLEGQPEDGTEEDPVEETEEPDPETVSGNDLVVSGDVIIFPEGYDLAGLAGEPVDVDTESIVQAIEKQDDILTAGFACTSFMLGLLAGALLIAGFRLRRV